ncbi:MAG: S1 RNA-binding domain-containing protein [Patescibacteria group bacterium]
MVNDTNTTEVESEKDADFEIKQRDIAKHPMEALLKQKIDAGMYIKIGDIVDGTILFREGNRLFIDMDARGVGVVFGKEFYEAQHVIRGLKIGDAVTAKVVELESSIIEGYPELSLKEAGKEKLWVDLQEIMRTGATLTLRVKEVNRGGLMMEHSGVVGFLPVSQLSQKNYPRVEGGDKEKIFVELKKFLGKDFKVKIIDVHQDEGKLIFSERELDNDALRGFVNKHTIGECVDGEITAIAPFGAFVRLADGLEGLIHVSEVDWQLVHDPRDVVKIGEKVRVKIITIEGTKISLSLKALKDDPWLAFQEVIKKGDTAKGTIVKFNSFGAFVKTVFVLPNGESREIQGLIHISEFGTEAKMLETIEIGKEYEFIVTSVDLQEHRMSLALSKKEEEKEEHGEGKK